MSNFDESKHKRDTNGKFTDKASTTMHKTDMYGNIVDNQADPLESLREQVRQEYRQEQMEKVKAEYEQSINSGIVAYVIAVRSGKASKSLTLAPMTIREVESIRNLTGIDTSRYSRIITADSVRHIDNRHGKNGKADKSMSDINDIARIEYVLANFDGVEIVDMDKQLQNSDGTFGKQLRYSKRVNGNYYITETVVDNKKKQLIIKSAYKNKADK